MNADDSIGGDGRGRSDSTGLTRWGERAADAGAGGRRCPSAERIGKWNVSDDVEEKDKPGDGGEGTVGELIGDMSRWEGPLFRRRCCEPQPPRRGVWCASDMD